MNKDISDTRYDMIKKHHTETLLKAIEEKKADEVVVPFLLEVTKIPDIFTSSSCCGRILLLSTDREENKKYSHFHERFHRLITFDEFEKIVSESKEGYLWLKIEPFIFHFGCKDYQTAENILEFCRDFGLKKAGIISAKEGKFIIEVTNTVYMSSLLKIDDKLLVDQDYLKLVVDLANEKLDKNFKRLKDFENAFLEKYLKK